MKQIQDPPQDNELTHGRMPLTQSTHPLALALGDLEGVTRPLSCTGEREAQGQGQRTGRRPGSGRAGEVGGGLRDSGPVTVPMVEHKGGRGGCQYCSLSSAGGRCPLLVKSDAC